jgi:hypothetical protein
VLLIVFLAAPASAIAEGSDSGTGVTNSVAASGSSSKSISPSAVKVVKLAPCATKCDAYVRYTDYTTNIITTAVAYSFKMNGITIKLIIQYTQKTEGGHSRRTCTTMTRCSVNKLCEKSGTYTQDSGSWKKIYPKVITGYWLE